MKYFGGIEGGATHSHLVICDESGEACATTTGLGTNHWGIGIQECARRIADMVERAKQDAGIAEEIRLMSLGLSLSGCEQEATNRELELELRTTHPNVADNYVVCSDTLGSVFTSSPKGGMVVISGTGSNALLRNPDGSTYTCGGWGNYLGDEGSAWYIAHRAMKLVFDDMDNFVKSPYPIERAWQLIRQHFNIETRLDLLPHCYAKFDKPFFASLCKKLALAAEEGDPLACHLFREAGELIARSILALLPRVQPELTVPDGLNIVCVGSVWLSWNLLRDGFTAALDAAKDVQPLKFDLKLVRITKSAAFGACYLGVDDIKHPLPRNYADNVIVMYRHQCQKLTNGTNGSLLSSSSSNAVNGNGNCH